MKSFKTALDVISNIKALRSEYPDFVHPIKMPDAQDEYFANIATAVTKIIQEEVPAKWLYYEGETYSLLEERFNRLAAAVRDNNYDAFDAVCHEILAHIDIGPDDVDPNVTPVDCGHDPGCASIDGQILWFYVTKCFTKMLCILQHAAASTTTDSLFLGHCDNKETYPECKCKPIRFPLSALIFLLSVVLFFFAGPAIGAAGREMLRQIVTKLAPAA